MSEREQEARIVELEYQLSGIRICLQEIRNDHWTHWPDSDIQKVNKALADTADISQQQGQGEPVAWIDKDSLQHLIDDGVSGYGYSLRAKGIYGTDVPLFTSPPAARDQRVIEAAEKMKAFILEWHNTETCPEDGEEYDEIMERITAMAIDALDEFDKAKQP